MEEFQVRDGRFVRWDRVDGFEGTEIPDSDRVVVGTGGDLVSVGVLKEGSGVRKNVKVGSASDA